MALKELDATPELRDDPALKDFNDVLGLAKSFKDTKAFVGTSIRPPGDNATPEARAEFYEKLKKHAPNLVPLDDKDEAAQTLVWDRLGRPKDAAGYEFKPPEGVTIDMEALRAAAVTAGFTKGQFQKFAEATVAAEQKKTDAVAADTKALRLEWGHAYEQKCQEAASAAAKLDAPAGVVQLIRDGKLPSEQLKMWAKLSAALGKEGTQISQQNGKQTDNVTPAEAQAQIDEIMANPAYFDRNHPQHGRLVKEVVRLGELMEPRA